MAVRGALFDFSGTLFRLEFEPQGLDRATHTKMLQMLTAPVRPSEHLPPDLLADWERRDLDPTLHRRVNVAALRGSGLAEDGAAEAFYDLMLDPASWKPYPDTLAVLERLRAADVRVAVVSNIAWDIRDVFERVGAAGYVDEFVLSYREGVVKPDPAIFTTACGRLGVEPPEAIMVGDSERADGGATAVGCSAEIVEALPTDERPDALLRAVSPLTG